MVYVWSPAWELPYATDADKKKKRKKERKKEGNYTQKISFEFISKKKWGNDPGQGNQVQIPYVNALPGPPRHTENF